LSWFKTISTDYSLQPRFNYKSRPKRFLWFLLIVILSGCATSRINLSLGVGIPLRDFKGVFSSAIGPCRQVKTLELMFAISGRMGKESLRGRVRGAFEYPASLRLEGLAPFGSPGFILVAQPSAAVLLLPRERRIISDANAQELLGELAGVTLGPADFGALLTGCLFSDLHPRAARSYRNGWIGIDLEGGATIYLQMINDIPVITAGTRDGLIVEYRDYVRGLPRRIRMQSLGVGQATTDLTVVLSQVSINTDLHPDVFLIQTSQDYLPMSFNEFRATVGSLEDPLQSDP
jgi:hypothetical protein